MQRNRKDEPLPPFDPEPERTLARVRREARDRKALAIVLASLSTGMAEERAVAVRDVALPSLGGVASSIVNPFITGHFEIKPSTIQLLHVTGQYVGLLREDPQQHIQNFLEISDTYTPAGVPIDDVCLTLFPFSLI